MITEKIMLKNSERFEKPHYISREKLIRAAERATNKLEALSKKCGDGFPRACSFDYKYIPDENKDWVGGLYTGCFWLAYEITGNEFFRKEAERHMPVYEKRFEEKIGLTGHDVGFPYTPSCVAQYKITGNEKARKLALDVADFFLKNAYKSSGKYHFISRNKVPDEYNSFRTMMDTLMNMGLLFWAGIQTGESRFTKAALDQSVTCKDLLIRADGSSYHHYMFDAQTQEPMRGLTFQGHADESCWSRGHAWGVYGFPLAYSYTKADFLPELHQGVTYFMLNHLPEDCIPYWDYDFTDGDEPRDASAGVISACGMMEMASLLSESNPDKNIFINAADMILDSTIDRCTGDIGVEYDGLICHVTHSIPHNVGIDGCAPYADFFYLEALARKLNPDFKKYW